MIPIEQMLKEEISKLIPNLNKQKISPGLVSDMSTLPIRMSRGEDVSVLLNSIQAEIAMLNVTSSMDAQKAVREAWTNLIIRILSTAILVI